MKRHLFAAVLFLAVCSPAFAQPSAGGVVYGPKAAFNIKAPDGWVLDPTAGADQGQPCVLYLKGATWETSDPVMYARIASTDTEDAEAFAKRAIAGMKSERKGFKFKRLTSGKTAGGMPYFINEYPATKEYSRSERVAYVQLSKAVAYIVFSADEETAFRKHKDALEETVKSMLSLAVNYPGKPKAEE